MTRMSAIEHALTNSVNPPKQEIADALAGFRRDAQRLDAAGRHC